MRLRVLTSTLALAGCTLLLDCQNPTEFTVAVFTDVPCNRIKDVFFVAGAPDTVEGRDPTSVLAPVTCGADGKLGSVVVVPSGDKNAEVGLRVVAGLDGVSAKSCVEGGACIVARRRLRYVPHTPLNVPIRLAASCAGRFCDSGATCQAGTCVSSTIDCSGDTCELPVPPPARAGTWTATPSLPTPRTRHVAAWASNQLWIWGGMSTNGLVSDGFRLAAGTFSPIPSSGLEARETDTTVFTGAELLFASGIGTRGDGARFDGAAWKTIADVTQKIPNFAARSEAAAAWEPKSKLFMIWGGFDNQSLVVDDGAIYDPAKDAWTKMSAAPLAPRARAGAVAVGGKVIIYGGECGGTCVDGAIFDPAANQWGVTFKPNTAGRARPLALSDGTRAIFYGGQDANGAIGPHGDSVWVDAKGSAVVHTGVGAPAPRVDAAGFVAYGRVFVWGGRDTTKALGDGGVYDPTTDTWTALATTGAPTARFNATMTWNGSQAILFGGETPDGSPLATGAVFTP